MTILVLFLMVLGAVLFGLGVIITPEPQRFRFVPAGLFFWILAEIILRYGH